MPRVVFVRASECKRDSVVFRREGHKDGHLFQFLPRQVLELRTPVMVPVFRVGRGKETAAPAGASKKYAKSRVTPDPSAPERFRPAAKEISSEESSEKPAHE
jgi:hypothetical protein